MKELSLHILDIAENSAKAGAGLIGISITEKGGILTLRITDDGCGMKPEMLSRVTDPFTTSRTTRKVGLGLPLLRLAAEQTGGSLEITSRHIDEFPEDHGTVVTAVFDTRHIDSPPLGDVISTIVTLIQGHPGQRPAVLPYGGESRGVARHKRAAGGPRGCSAFNAGCARLDKGQSFGTIRGWRRKLRLRQIIPAH